MTDPGAAPVASRAIAPDVARGAMLVLIALANVHVYAFDHALGPRGYPRDLSVADQVVVVLQMLLVDGRAYPLFALLIGYGIVQLSRRRTESGNGAVVGDEHRASARPVDAADRLCPRRVVVARRHHRRLRLDRACLRRRTDPALLPSACGDGSRRDPALGLDLQRSIAGDAG